MSPLVVNRKLTSKYDVYVGRPTKWGNPFKVSETLTRRQAIVSYAVWMLDNPKLLAQLDELEGKMLACSCRPAECHADVLAELAKGASGWYFRSEYEPRWECHFIPLPRWLMVVFANGEWMSACDVPYATRPPVASVELAKYLAVEEWVSRCVFGEL
jgi:hypothetical protein